MEENNARKSGVEKDSAEKNHAGKDYAGKNRAGKDHAGKNREGKNDRSGKEMGKKILSMLAVPLALILIEAAFLLYAASRGRAGLYLKVAVPMYLVILAIYIFARVIGANERIVIWTAVLLTIGMFMQILLIGHLTAERNAAKSIVYEIYQLSEGKEADLSEHLSREQAESIVQELNIDFSKIEKASKLTSAQVEAAGSYLKKSEVFPDYNKELEARTQIRENASAGELVKNLFLGLAAAVLVAVFMLTVYGHYYDFVIQILMIFHLLLLVVMMLFGSGVTGDGSKINLLGVQPLELVKLFYLFVLAGLLCKPERSERKIWGLKRSTLAICYMLLNAGFFLLLKELGTLLILTCTGLCLMFIFCEDRKEFWKAFLLHGTAGILGVFMAVFNITEVGRRLNSRFIYYRNPGLDAYGKGFQYIQMKKAMAVSGWFGADAPRYKFYMAAEENDAVFAKLIQVSGILLAIVVIICYIALLLEGYKAAYQSADLYYRGLAMGISIMLAFQGIVHIACNVGLFPMTGVPLLFLSKGGSNQMVSLIITALLLIISTGGMKRAAADEEKFEEEKDYGKKIQKFFR